MHVEADLILDREADRGAMFTRFLTWRRGRRQPHETQPSNTASNEDEPD